MRPYLERNGKRIPLTLVGKVTWLLASILRLGVLLPVHLALVVNGLAYFTISLICVSNLTTVKKRDEEYVKIFESAFRVLIVSSGGIIRFHDEENAPSGKVSENAKR